MLSASAQAWYRPALRRNSANVRSSSALVSVVVVADGPERAFYEVARSRLVERRQQDRKRAKICQRHSAGLAEHPRQRDDSPAFEARLAIVRQALTDAAGHDNWRRGNVAFDRRCDRLQKPVPCGSFPNGVNRYEQEDVASTMPKARTSSPHTGIAGRFVSTTRIVALWPSVQDVGGFLTASRSGS